MDLEITILGTSGAVPTPERALSAYVLKRGAHHVLVDCGEGTQRQLMRAGVGMTSVDAVVLTHWHTDHFLGLPGMFKTWDLWGRTEPVTVYGPKGIGSLGPVIKRLTGHTNYAISYVEVAPGSRFELGGMAASAIETDHRVASVGWRFAEPSRPGRFDPEEARRLGARPGPDFGRLQRGEAVMGELGELVRPEQVMGEARQGRTVVFTGDTRPCPGVLEAARGASVLVHDATFANEAADRAAETHHATAAEAAALAREAEVGLLVLTHFSFRHPPKVLLAEAREVYPAVCLPSDLDRVVVPFPERGAPEHVDARAWRARQRESGSAGV